MRIFLLVVSICLSTCIQVYAAQQSPNIVVIMTDDQNDTGDMSVMRKTLRALADEGVTFTNSFTNFPLCCPSRASFLTGQAAHNHRITENKPPHGGYKKFAAQERKNLGVWLQAVGYRTGFIGKFMNGYSEPGTHPIPGWSDWRALVTPDDSDYEHYYDYRMNENGTINSYGREPRDYLTDVITRHATRFIERSAALRKPFFLYVGHHAPHESAIAAPRHEGVYDGRSLPPRPNFNELVVTDKPRAVGISPRMEESDKRRVTQLYRDRLESLLAVDESVQEIMNSLRQTGTLHNTYIVFTSDNGFMLGEHRFVSKSFVYEESVRVPLIIIGPNVPRGVKRPQLVNNLDLVATLVDLSGATPSHVLDGVSLLPLMRDPDTPWRRALLIEGRIREETTYSAVRTVDRVYVEYRSPQFGKEFEFYNLGSDPYQLLNIAVSNEIKSRFQPLLERLRNCVGRECWTPERDDSARQNSSLR